MNILYLGRRRESLLEHVGSWGDSVLHTEDNLNAHPELTECADIIVSYGYRFILSRELVDRFSNRIVNLHISLLPWNRGADPNVWSFLEDTPKGVTIHYIDCGVDTGPILAQQEIDLSSEETLCSSYHKLSGVVEHLFKKTWAAIRSGRIETNPQVGKGSYHRVKDLEPYRHLLVQGWDTPVAGLIGRALTSAGRVEYAE
jgi:methionyl-tRNA formyltransferase